MLLVELQSIFNCVLSTVDLAIFSRLPFGNQSNMLIIYATIGFANLGAV